MNILENKPSEQEMERFYKLLEYTKDMKWRITPSGKIRCENLTCPLNAIAGRKGYSLYKKQRGYYDEIKKLGFQELTLNFIIRGADYGSHAYHNYVPEIRNKILQILNLKEK